MSVVGSVVNWATSLVESMVAWVAATEAIVVTVPLTHDAFVGAFAMIVLLVAVKLVARAARGVRR